MGDVNTVITEGEEGRYRNILDSALDSVFVIHRSTYVYVNKQGAKLLGYDSPEDIIGKNMYAHTHEDDHEVVRERGRARRRGEEVLSRYELKLIRLNGEVFPAEVNVSYIEYDGKACSLSYVRDITERKRYEDRLQVLHMFTAQMALCKEISEIETITYSAISQVLGFNRGSLSFVKGKVLSHDFRWNMNFIGSYEMPLDGPGITVRAVNTGETQLVGDVLEDPDYILGGEYEMATRSELVSPIKIRDRVVGIINIENKLVDAFSMDDVRIIEILAVHIGSALDRMEYLEEMDRVRRNRDRELIDSFKRFSSMIQHDIKGPLSTIKTSVYLIEKKPQSLDMLLRLIKTSVEVTDSILADWNQKIYSHAITKTETNIYGMVQDALQSIIVHDNVDVVREIPENLTYVLDGGSILRVMVNLIRNAVEAMPTGGEMYIGAHVEDGGLFITVRDNGAGISEEFQEDLFTPFHSNKEMGTGLGLAYCKQAVEAHEGRISFKSEQGEGTEFTVHIP